MKKDLLRVSALLAIALSLSACAIPWSEKTPAQKRAIWVPLASAGAAAALAHDDGDTFITNVYEGDTIINENNHCSKGKCR